MISRTASILTALLFMALPALADDLPQMPSTDTRSTIPEDPAVTQIYQVDCYLGNPSAGKNLGSLNVTSVKEAGPACNSTFYDCHDGCYGCITSGANICVDKAGTKFQR